MQVKTTVRFEPQDFDGCGQMIIRNTAEPGCKSHTFMATVSYKIGYMFKDRISNTILKISLANGMCRAFPSVEALCEDLNNDEAGFRPMTNEEITQVMLSQGSRFPRHQ